MSLHSTRPAAMRGSLVILAALCVIVAAEASSVRFVSIDEGQNGKDKKDRSEASDGTDPGIKKSVEDVVKKINDGNDQPEKTVKSLEIEKSSGDDKNSDGTGEGVKRSESPEKPKVQKRDVRKALELLSKRGMKRASPEGADAWNILNARKLIIKYLSLQRTVLSKITISIIYTVERLESDQNEREALIAALKTFEKDLEQTYDNTINALGNKIPVSDMPSDPQRKFMRADTMPAIMNTLNQRNPLAIIPLVTRLINAVAGAATIADVASSMSGTRSNVQNLPSLIETIEHWPFLTPDLTPGPWNDMMDDTDLYG